MNTFKTGEVTIDCVWQGMKKLINTRSLKNITIKFYRADTEIGQAYIS